MEILAFLACVVIGLFLVIPTKRNPDCTCKSHGFTLGPVNRCPVHKHMSEEDRDIFSGDTPWFTPCADCGTDLRRNEICDCQRREN